MVSVGWRRISGYATLLQKEEGCVESNRNNDEQQASDEYMSFYSLLDGSI
jgi:hypothetical protein